jgi:RNA polymerase sigma-70 factor (ECF subfamily)
MNKTNAPYNIRELQHQISLYEDQEAYKRLFCLLFPSLQNFAYSILKSRMNAEEIVSDVFIKVWEIRSRLMEIENLQLYLYVSVKNSSLRKLQKEKGERILSIDYLEIESISDYISPEEKLQLSETEKTIDDAVQHLPPRCKLIFKLAKEDKLKYKEIAALLNISIKTIDAQLAIALKSIGFALKQKFYSKK